jgi:hypothetical protein
MLYQLSYASVAETNGQYQTGIAIARTKQNTTRPDGSSSYEATILHGQPAFGHAQLSIPMDRP